MLITMCFLVQRLSHQEDPQRPQEWPPQDLGTFKLWNLELETPLNIYKNINYNF
jgi:hypothetical protein